MALSPLEKVRLQKELKANKAALVAATNPLDKLKLQKERKSLWKQLKGSQAGSEPAAAEPAVLTLPPGIDRNYQLKDGDKFNLGGGYWLVADGSQFSHPDIYMVGIYTGDESDKPTLNNSVAFKTNNVIFKRNKPVEPIRPITVGQIMSQAQELHPELSVAYQEEEAPPAPMSVEEFSQLGRTEQQKQLDTLLRLPNWYEYETAFMGSKVVSQGDSWVVLDNAGYLTFGYRGHLSRHKDYWKKDAGSQKANGGFGSWSRADRSRAIKELEKVEDQIAGGKEAGKKKREQAAFLARLDKRPERLSENDYLLADRFNIYAMGGDYIVNDNQNEYVVEGTFDSLDAAIDATKRAVINKEVEPTEPAPDPAVNPMLEQYREGQFNGQAADDFKATMQQVYDLGMPVNEVATGMIDWFKENPDQLAA